MTLIVSKNQLFQNEKFAFYCIRIIILTLRAAVA